MAGVVTSVAMGVTATTRTTVTAAVPSASGDPAQGQVLDHEPHNGTHELGGEAIHEV